MSPRRLMAWALILAVAAGAWLLSNYLDQRHQHEESQASRLFEAEAVMAAQALELSGAQYPQPIRLERGPGQGNWRLARPVSERADGLAVGRLLTSLAQARVSQVLSQPGPLADFGLAPPRLELVLIDRQGQKSQLLLGELSPSGESVYLARPGQAEVLLAPAGLRGALVRGLFDLRDKVVLDFPVAQARRVELRPAGAPALVLERAEQTGAWTLAGQGVADPREVEGLLFQAHGLLAQGFVDKDFKPAKLGLEPPRASLLITLADGAQAGLNWGLKVPGKNQTYARRLAGGPVLLLQDESLGRLERRPADLLDRRLFTLERGEVARLVLARPEGQIVFARQEGQWRCLEPAEQGPPGQVAEDLLWELMDQKWERPLPAGDYGLDGPRLSIILTTAAGGEQGLHIGRRDPASGLVAARLAGATQILGLNAALLDKIPPGAGAPPARENKLTNQGSK